MKSAGAGLPDFDPNIQGPVTSKDLEGRGFRITQATGGELQCVLVIQSISKNTSEEVAWAFGSVPLKAKVQVRVNPALEVR